MMDFRFFGFHIFIAKRKEVKDMVAIYVALIIKGLYTIDKVPYTVKEDVKAMLIELELPELAEEKEQA